MDRRMEIKAKLARVAACLTEHKLDGVILSRRDNFSWMTAGGSGHVATNVDEGAASLLVTPDSVTVLTSNIEEPRIMTEEVASTDISAITWPWHGNKIAKIQELIAGKTFGSDNGIAGTANIGKAIAALRYSMLPSERERYMTLCKDATVALENAARNVKPGMTEYEISANLAEELIQRGLEPTVNLVAADERIRRYRHPVPTYNVLKKHAMLVLCARRGGLVMAATRLVHFGPLPEELLKKHEALCYIEAAMYAATKPGVPVSEALEAGIQTYNEYGFADEWQMHHQGGPTGYNNREFTVTPGMMELVRDQQAFAWNPSITGAKNEDTILVSTSGFEVVTVGEGNWPNMTVPCNGMQLQRPGVLIL